MLHLTNTKNVSISTPGHTGTTSKLSYAGVSYTWPWLVMLGTTIVLAVISYALHEPQFALVGAIFALLHIALFGLGYLVLPIRTSWRLSPITQSSIQQLHYVPLIVVGVGGCIVLWQQQYLAAPQALSLLVPSCVLMPIYVVPWLFLFQSRAEQELDRQGLVASSPEALDLLRTAQWCVITDDFFSGARHELVWVDDQGSLQAESPVPGHVVKVVYAMLTCQQLASQTVQDYQLTVKDHSVTVTHEASGRWHAYVVPSQSIFQEIRHLGERGVKVILCTDKPYIVALYAAQRLGLAQRVKQILSASALSDIPTDDIGELYNFLAGVKVIAGSSAQSLAELVSLLARCAERITVFSLADESVVLNDVCKVMWPTIHTSTEKADIVLREPSLALYNAIVRKTHELDQRALRSVRYQQQMSVIAGAALMLLGAQAPCWQCWTYVVAAVAYAQLLLPCISAYFVDTYTRSCNHIVSKPYMQAVWVMALVATGAMIPFAITASYVHNALIVYVLFATSLLK